MRTATGALGIVLLCVAVEAGAEPYIALREGYKCGACHVNVTGGGMRTDFVASHARDILHYPDWFDALTKPAEKFTGEINQYVSIGADLRTSVTAIFQDEPDADGRVSNNEVFRGRLEEFDSSVNEAVGYLNVRLIPDLLEFYLDQRFAPTTDTREAWGLLRLPWNLYVKGGRMFLPYGLQVRDDEAFIRGGRNGSASTGFNFNQQAAGFELGYVPDPFAVIVAVSDGAGTRDAQVTGSAYAMFTDVPIVRNVFAGGSATRNGGSQEEILWGLYGGFNLGRFTYLGEVDFLERREHPDGDTSLPKEYLGGFINYNEADYLLFDWLNVKAVFEYADYDGDLAQNGSDAENGFSIGLEPFLARFLQVRVFYQIFNGVESIPSHNQNVLFGEAHVFF